MRRIRMILVLMLWAYAARGQVNTVQVMRVGENAMYYHDYLVAMHYFNMAIDAKPWLAEPYCKRGICKLQLGDAVGAEADLSMALERHPYAKGARGARATARHALGKLQEAIVDYDSALIDNPSNKALQHGRDLAMKGIVLPLRSGIKAAAEGGKPQPEPIYTLSFYTDDNELRNTLNLPREVEHINQSKSLRAPLFASAHPPVINDEPTMNYHEYSIDYYTRHFVDHAPKVIDLFGRGMDYYTMHNYAEATADFTRAIKMDSLCVVAYLMRGVSVYKEAEARYGGNSEENRMLRSAAMHNALDDFTRVTELSGKMAIGWYDRGVVELALGEYAAAEASFSRAIELRSDLGEAWYNRALARIAQKNAAEAAPDLSRAGELGIAAAYQLIRGINGEKSIQ